MTVLLFDTICLALLTVGLTGGLYVAAQGEGSLLYPVWHWLNSYGRSEKLFAEWQRLEQEIHNSYTSMKPQAEMAQLFVLRDRARSAYYRYAAWRKPILLCVRCMPSIYGTMTYIILLFYGISPLALLFAIPMATVINTIIFNNIKL